MLEKESIKNAIKLKESFPNLTFGIGSILNIKQYKEIQSYNFDFFVSPCIIYEIINSKVLNYIPGAETIKDFKLDKKKSIYFLFFWEFLILITAMVYHHFYLDKPLFYSF